MSNHKTPWAVCALALAGLSPSAHAISLAVPNVTQVVNVGTQQALFTAGALTGSRNTTNGHTSVALGSSPTLLATMTEASGASGGVGGSVYAQLQYSVAFENPGAGTGLIGVRVSAYDVLEAQVSGYSASAIAHASFEISGGGTSRAFYDCTFANTDLVWSDQCGGQYDTVAPFDFDMRQNTVYTVLMRVDAQASAGLHVSGPSQAFASAWLDPTFALKSGGPLTGGFVYSAGVTHAAAVPEPTGWALMLAGLGVLGARRRRRPQA